MARNDRYFVEAASRVLDVLGLFEQREEVRLADVMQELGMIKSTAFRLLYTLEQKGLIEHSSSGAGYRRRRPRRIGFASISDSIPFVAEVERGVLDEASRCGMEVLVRRHNFQPAKAVRDVDDLIASGVALLLCYNPDEHISHVIADRCAQAAIPIVAVTFPVPGGRLFGVNNYRAGLVGGEGLGEQIRRRWNAAVDFAVVLDIPGKSPAQQARLTGMVEGLRKYVAVPPGRLLHLQTDRRRRTAETLMAGFLDRHPQAARIAVLSYNDVNALGALRALEAAGRSDHALIVSQGGVTEVREEICRPRSALWGAVAHFPERFGARLIPFAARLLASEPAPTVLYTEHVLLTRSTMERYYPGAGQRQAKLTSKSDTP